MAGGDCERGRRAAGKNTDAAAQFRNGANRAGGKEDDKTIVVYDPAKGDKSLIIEGIEYKNEDLQMPPPKKGKSMKLTDQQITDMKEWVRLGVPYGEKPVEAAKTADK